MLLSEYSCDVDNCKEASTQISKQVISRFFYTEERYGYNGWCHDSQLEIVHTLRWHLKNILFQKCQRDIRQEYQLEVPKCIVQTDTEIYFLDVSYGCHNSNESMDNWFSLFGVQQ